MCHNLFYIFILGTAFFSLSACSLFKPAPVPEPLPIVSETVSEPISEPISEPEVQLPCYSIKHSLGVIGVVEPVYVLPMKSSLAARIDTGAETSSIDAQNVKFFERDSEKWVSFDVINRKNGQKHHFEKKIYRRTAIKRIEGSEYRTVVQMRIRFGNEIITSQFTLTDRSKFEYQVLIGRNILAGRAIVDASAQNTLP